MDRMVEDLNVIESTLSKYKQELNSKNNDKTLKRYIKNLYEDNREVNNSINNVKFKDKPAIFALRYTAAMTSLIGEESLTELHAFGIILLTGLSGNKYERNNIFRYLCTRYNLENLWTQTNKKESEWKAYWAVCISKVIEIVTIANRI